MTFDGYWEMNEKAADERRQQLEEHFWVIRDAKGRDVTPAKTHATAEAAWRECVREPFTRADYEQKGYRAVNIEVAAVRRAMQDAKRYVS